VPDLNSRVETSTSDCGGWIISGATGATVATGCGSGSSIDDAINPMMIAPMIEIPAIMILTLFI
jgi:hypothetical protein